MTPLPPQRALVMPSPLGKGQRVCCLYSTNAHPQGKWGHKLKKRFFRLTLRLPDLQKHRFILLTGDQAKTILTL
jgi:hypothetical protein